jgi:uncharacterized protein (TIGR02466 family)
MNINILEKILWPTMVWEGKVLEIDNDSIKNYCYTVKKEKPGVMLSNRGGWHSKDLVFPIPSVLNTLFEGVTKIVNEVSYKFTGISNLEIGNWWININGQYDYNTPHDHQNSILSGIYYISVPCKNMGDLVLHRGDNAEYFFTSKISRIDNLNNSTSIRLPVEESKFYIFPSWVKHSVERNESPQERISVAFNFIQK